MQHSWILSAARLVDPPYFQKNKSRPRLSIYYILELLKDDILKQELIDKLNSYNDFISSIKRHRDNFLAHNSIDFPNNKIEAGVENFFQELDNIIKRIKKNYPYLKECNDINLVFTEKLSEEGVKEIFEKIK